MKQHVVGGYLDTRHKHLVTELMALKARYGTLDNMVKELRHYPSFSKISKSSLSRWFTTPSDRTQLAIEFLNQKFSGSKVSIAVSDTLWSLNFKLLFDTRYQEFASKFQFGAPLKENGVEVHLFTPDTGGEAMTMLEEGEVDIAVAAKEFSNEDSVSYLCDVSSSLLSGISRKPIESRKAFYCDYKIGFPVATKLRTLIKDFALEWGAIEPNTKPLEVRDFPYALFKNDVDALIGWQPIIDNVRTELKQELELFDIPGSMLGKMDMVLYANQQTIEIKTLFPLLQALDNVTTFLQEHKLQDELVKTVSEIEEIKKKQVYSILQDSFFVFKNINLKSLVQLRMG